MALSSSTHCIFAGTRLSLTSDGFCRLLSHQCDAKSIHFPDVLLNPLSYVWGVLLIVCSNKAPAWCGTGDSGCTDGPEWHDARGHAWLRNHARLDIDTSQPCFFPSSSCIRTGCQLRAWDDSVLILGVEEIRISPPWRSSAGNIIRP